MSVENRPNNHKLIRILTAAGILGGTGAVVGGKVILDELSKAKPAVSAELIPSPASAVTINSERYVVAPTATAVPTETVAPPLPTPTKDKAASTATASATPPLPAKEAATKVPTAKPVDTATATSTATNTATATATVTATTAAVEKSPLPGYGAFTGVLPDNKGSIAIISIPGADGRDSIVVYAIIINPDGSRGFIQYSTKPVNIKGRTFQANSPVPLTSKEQTPLNRMRIAVSADGKVLSGTIESGWAWRAEVWRSDLELQYIGSGPAKAKEALQRTELTGQHSTGPWSSARPTLSKNILDWDNLPPE